MPLNQQIAGKETGAGDDAQHYICFFAQGHAIVSVVLYVQQCYDDKKILTRLQKFGGCTQGGT